MRIRDRFPVILFDMNHTFMFGEDRFGEHEDFYKTYLQLGGADLSSQEVNLAIRQCFEGMDLAYKDPSRADSFLTVAEALQTFTALVSAPAQELKLLVDVFAEHEVGFVPKPHADFLRDLSSTNQLGLVSNIWAPKNRWLAEFERAGIDQAFRAIVFSSDGRSVKPSKRLFLDALAFLDAAPADALFVGDSLTHDIAPARGLGMRTAWITTTPVDAIHSGSADYVFQSILELDAAD